MDAKVWTYQRSGDRHLLIAKGGREVLNLTWFEIGQHTLFSGASYRYHGETLDGFGLIERLNREPKLKPKQAIALYLPEMYQRRTHRRSVD